MEEIHQHEEISVAFYYNDQSRKRSFNCNLGMETMFKTNMNYWHTEIAFPSELFDFSKNSNGKKDDRFFAFGVFSDQTDTFVCRKIEHINPNITLLSTTSGYKLYISSTNKKRKIINQKYYKQDMGQIVLGGKNNINMVTGESFQFYGPCQMEWNVENKLAGRVNRYNLKSIIIEYNYQTNIAQIKSPGMVFGKPREFSNPNYRWIHFLIPL